jgi:hypothetical protein
MASAVLRPARFVLSAVCVFPLLVIGSTTSADDTDVVLIEEHWELHVGGPDASRSAPQVSMIMSPTDTLSGDFFVVSLNHWSYPNFVAGGYQVQRWHGGECVDADNGYKTSQLHHDGEVITWVQRLSLDDGVLKFTLLNGDSDTWGHFGGAGLNVQLATNLTKLNGYRPGISIDQSGIGYAGNRVSSLTLKKIRWITADGEEHHMVAPIDIDSDLDP